MSENPAYELFDELGHGENTVVYRGYDLALGRDVAIKELDEKSRKDARRASQFLKEASFLAQFEHENILRIYTVDKERGWIVMELMKGTLASQIADEAMPADTVRSVLRQILGALDFLHQKNKVHGAVRPSNILINEVGTAKLSDFEATDTDGELRAPTGSKKHLAPELIRPEFGEFGPAVDLYCLGFTALELLTGKKFESLFPGTGEGAIDADVAWLRWHSSDEALTPVKKLCPNVPDDLANVIDKLLSKNVADRPESAKEVLGLLSEQDFIPVVVKNVASPAGSATGASATPTSTVRNVGPATTSSPASKTDAKQKEKKKKKKVIGAVATKTTKDKINDFLGKPYVLWPLCASMLIGAALLGLKLQGGDEETPEVGPPTVELAEVQINISPSPDGVQLFLNGESKSTSESTSYQLEAGEYELRVSKEGYADHTQKFAVATADKQIDVLLLELTPPVDPEPQLANVRLDIAPGKEGVIVLLDGEPSTPDENDTLVLKPGIYQLKVAKEGFEDHDQTLNVAPGDLLVSIALKEIPKPTSGFVKVAVSVSPSVAALDTPEQIDRLPESTSERANFEIKLAEKANLILGAKKDGYVPASRSITWEELVAAKFKIDLSLEPLPEEKIVEVTPDPEPDPGLVDPFATKLVRADDNNDEVEKLKKEFTGEAELVIDSGGFLDELSDVSFSPDGKLVAGAGGKVVRIWNVETGELVTTLRGDRSRTSYGNVFAAAFSPDGKSLLVGINDYKAHGSIREYSTDDFSEIKRLIPGHTAPCRKIEFNGSGSRRISVDADGNLLIVDTATDKTVGKIKAANPDKPIFDMISFPDGKGEHIIALDFDGPKVFSPTGQILGPQDSLPDNILGWFMDIFTKKVQYPFGSTKDPRVLDFAMEDNEWAAAGVSLVEGRNKFWAAVYPSRGSKESTSMSQPKQVYAGHRWSITCVELGPNGDLAASGDKFGEVHVWNRKTGKLVHRFKGQGKSIYEVGFDENSNRIAFGTRPFKPDVWNRNKYGSATQVLDLKQRAILPIAATDDLRLNNEQPKIGGTEVNVTKAANDASFHVNLKQSGRVVSKYRISSARNPTVYTLIDEPKLGVQKPVIFGDAEGLLAMWDSSGDELRRAFIGHGSLVSGVSFARNGKLMVSASTDRTIRIWSLENHTPTGTFDFKFENTSVIKLTPGSSSAKAGVKVGDEIISMDGLSVTDMYNKMLQQDFDYRPGQVVPMKMKRDGREYSYKMTMGEGYDFVEPTLNFYVGDAGEWIIWSPIGYYDASPGADRLIGWHVNRGPAKSAKYFEVQQFRKQLYRPDVINLILDGNDVKDAVRIANESKNVEVAEHDFRSPDEIAINYPPEVRLVSPTKDVLTTDSSFKFRAQVVSPNGLPIKEATLLHNGNAVKVFKPTDLRGQTLSIAHDVDLTAGANRLELVALNAKASSQAIGVNVTLKTRKPKAVSDVHVLAVGISSHKNAASGLEDLASASVDAKAFAQAVESHKNGKLYRNVNVRLLTDKEATRTNIVDGFQWLVDNVKPNDSVVVFFAGNAFVDSQENFYLATHDIEAGKLRATALEWRQFTRMLHEDLPKCTRLVFLDAQPSKGGIKPGMRNPLLDLAAPELGTTFFASNTLQQPTVKSPSAKHGAFVQAIIETLRDKKADLVPNPRDQLLNPTELAKSIRARVQKASAGKQLPTHFAATGQRTRNLLELFPSGGRN